MWVTQIICIPFKAVVLVFKWIQVFFVGCKVVTPYVDAGLNKAIEAAEGWKRTAQELADEQTRTRVEAEITNATQLKQLQYQLDAELAATAGVELLEAPKRKIKAAYLPASSKVVQSDAEIAEDLRKEREARWEDLRKQYKEREDQ